MARAAGAVLLGKTVTTEFANVTPGPTRNPLATDRTPGGSSSGSAAAVAAGMVPVAYGTQTTQSTIRPASYCGVHGYCPTQGDFRLSGVREAAGSFDRLGLITRSVADIALFRDVLLRRRPRPFAAWPEPPSIGFCRTPLWPTMDSTLQKELSRAADQLAKAGATVVEIELPPSFSVLPEAHRAVSSFEFVRNFAYEIDRHWERISPALRHGRIADGLAMNFERYAAAGAAIAEAQAQLPDVFDRIDLIMTASTLGEAPHGFGTTGSAVIGAYFTPLGLPCITIPAFKGPTAMPMGLQALGPLGGDDALLAQAAWIEANL
ncbi:MAG: amidase, partial [Alphaproteobacteria bacterium]